MSEEPEASEAESGGDVVQRWQVFGQLISSPRLPSGLE